MEAHLKNKHALAVCEAIWSEDAGGTAPLEDPPEVKKTRNAGEDIPYEKIIQMTDMARDMGASRAERNWKRVHEEDVSRQTFTKYLNFYQEKAKVASIPCNERYFKPSERGRDFFLEEHEKNCVLQAISLFRKKKKSVNARVVSRIARGTVRRLRPGLIEEQVVSLGLSWAKKFMLRHKLKVRATQTDRTVTVEEVLLGTKTFFGQLHKLRADTTKKYADWATFNMDEFYCSLDLSGSSWKWTWHYADDPKPTAVAQTKVGFTASILSSADGKLHSLQMLWKGATTVSHADGDDPMIYQDHRPDSHFQDQESFDRWSVDFLKRWHALCVERNEFDVTPVIILDGAPQHMHQILLDAGVKVVMVPFKQTHVFQPADQWIIAALRSQVLQGWSEWVEGVFANNDVQHAVSVIITNSAPKIRAKKFELFSRALRKVSVKCVVDSWVRTGVLRELFGMKLKDGETVNSDDYHPEDREGDGFVVQGDGVENMDDLLDDAEEEVAPAIAADICVWAGLSAKGKFPIDVAQNTIDKKAKVEMKRVAKAKTRAARTGFVSDRQQNGAKKRNLDID